MAARVYIAWCKHERESLGEFESLCELSLGEPGRSFSISFIK